MSESENTKTPLFSVVIPVFNKEPHIARCIQSVLDQDCDDYEIIAVHDPSTDNSLQELKRFEKDIQIIQRAESGPGGYAARNVGVQNAKGKWIAFLDADDEWKENHLSVRKELINDFPQADILSSAWIINDDEGIHTKDKYYQENKSRKKHSITLRDYLGQSRPICTIVATIKQTRLLETGGFDESWSHGADKELWLRLFLEGSKGAWAPVTTAVYHRDSVNMVTDNFFQMESPSTFRIRNFLEEHPDFELEKLLKKVSNNEATKAILRGATLQNVDWEDVKKIFYLDKNVLKDFKQLIRVVLVFIFIKLPLNLKQVCLKIINKYYNI